MTSDRIVTILSGYLQNIRYVAIHFFLSQIMYILLPKIVLTIPAGSAIYVLSRTWVSWAGGANTLLLQDFLYPLKGWKTIL